MKLDAIQVDMYLTITLGDNKFNDDTENDIFIMCDTHAIESAQRESLRKH